MILSIEEDNIIPPLIRLNSFQKVMDKHVKYISILNILLIFPLFAHN